MRLIAARNGVFGVFAASGFTFSTLASRLPDIAHRLELSPGEMGNTLLFVAGGSVLGLPSAGWLITRWGAKRTVRATSMLALVALVIAGFAVDWIGSVWLLRIALIPLGFGIGAWDVAMNHEGAVVEQGLGRTVMPWYHAMFSGATVVAALLGSLLTWLTVPVWGHVLGIAIGAGVAVWLGTAAFLPIGDDLPGEEEVENATTGSAWLEPRTLLIGLVVLVAAFTEGTANDWIAIAMTSGHKLPAWAGVLGFATFLGFMTVGRIFGAKLLDTYGRVPVLRVLFGFAIAGSLLVVFGGSALAFFGAALWGIGASLGFPVGMSAASDDPTRAAKRLSVVSTIGYLAFLAGPPVLGHVGDAVGVLKALLIVGALLIPAFLAVPAVREPNDRRAAAPERSDPLAGA